MIRFENNPSSRAVSYQTRCPYRHLFRRLASIRTWWRAARSRSVISSMLFFDYDDHVCSPTRVLVAFCSRDSHSPNNRRKMPIRWLCINATPTKPTRCQHLNTSTTSPFSSHPSLEPSPSVHVCAHIFTVAKVSPFAVEVHDEDPASAPVFWVAKWVDYSNKYGLSYQLCDDSVGVLFNDNSKMLVDSAGQYVTISSNNCVRVHAFQTSSVY